MNNAKTNPVHISQIRAGDTIMHYGQLTTVCANNIKKGVFCGTSLFGDNYKLETKAVDKVVAWIGKDGSEWPVR